MIRSFPFAIAACCMAMAAFGMTAPTHAAPGFELSFDASVREQPVDGRLILAISARENGDPMNHVGWGVDTAQIFAIDVEGWEPGRRARIGAGVLGHPLEDLSELPKGSYRVQAVLNVYETFNRADGHVVKMPADNGEGQAWNRSPGNLYSEPQSIEIGASRKPIRIVLDRIIPPIEPAVDTRYVRHFRMKNDRLSRFWGTDVFISAIVLVPEGFDENPDARYPVLYNQGHFPAGLRFFSETPPQGENARFGSSAYEFYQHWVEGRVPKMLIVLTQHPTPFYDDSYGVNSANTGPYGDALMEDFYPALEEKFRGIGEAWSRVVYGGSTGGWMSLAQQIFYPDFFGGVWSLCPDPVDFHHFQLIDVYEDASGYYDEGPFKKLSKPLGRGRDGRPFTTMEDFDRQEEVLGARSRSGGQWDAFHATFGPVGEDGYPLELWEPLTGKIRPEVAEHWRENYDLNAILQRDWQTLGPKLAGKIHIAMGTQDTFYLEQAVYRMQEFLESTADPAKGPYYAGTIDLGDNQPHCYTGVPDTPGLNWQRYMMLQFRDHVVEMAPEGADTESWR